MSVLVPVLCGSPGAPRPYRPYRGAGNSWGSRVRFCKGLGMVLAAVVPPLSDPALWAFLAPGPCPLPSSSAVKWSSPGFCPSTFPEFGKGGGFSTRPGEIPVFIPTDGPSRGLGLLTHCSFPCLHQADVLSSAKVQEVWTGLLSLPKTVCPFRATSPFQPDASFSAPSPHLSQPM